jgi:hypothetical protein
VHCSLQPAAEVFLTGVFLKGSLSSLLDPEDRVSFHFSFHNSPTNNGDLEGHHPQRRLEGMNTTVCCLVPRRIVHDTG